MILYAHTEGPGLTAQIVRYVCAFPVCAFPVSTDIQILFYNKLPIYTITDAQQ